MVWWLLWVDRRKIEIEFSASAASYRRNITTALVAININFSSLIWFYSSHAFKTWVGNFYNSQFLLVFPCLMLTIFIIFLIFFLFHFNFRSRQCEFNFIMISYLLYNYYIAWGSSSSSTVKFKSTGWKGLFIRFNFISFHFVYKVWLSCVNFLTFLVMIVKISEFKSSMNVG